MFAWPERDAAIAMFGYTRDWALTAETDVGFVVYSNGIVVASRVVDKVDYDQLLLHRLIMDQLQRLLSSTPKRLRDLYLAAHTRVWNNAGRDPVVGEYVRDSYVKLMRDLRGLIVYPAATECGLRMWRPRALGDNFRYVCKDDAISTLPICGNMGDSHVRQYILNERLRCDQLVPEVVLVVLPGGQYWWPGVDGVFQCGGTFDVPKSAVNHV